MIVEVFLLILPLNNFVISMTMFEAFFEQSYFIDEDIWESGNKSGNFSISTYKNVRGVLSGRLAPPSPPRKTGGSRGCRGQACASTKRQKSRSRFFDRMFANYDKRLFPTNKTVVVTASIFVNSLDSISEVSFDYQLGIFLRLDWIDERLAFDPRQLDGEEKCDIATALHDDLWLPDLYITNEKKAIFHMVTTPNRLFTIASDGRVFFSRRLYATIHCQMELHTFPFDSQFCELTFESFAYTEKHIQLEWTEMPLEMTPNLAVPQFSIIGITFEKILRVTPRGNISSLVVTFAFSRDVGFYLLQIYLPSLFIVLTSFTAFWIDPLAVPARVTISVFTTLIMASMSTSLRNQLPLVSYIKAIDVWILACMVFVFLALVEYAIVNVLLRQKAKGLFLKSIFETVMGPGTAAKIRENLRRQEQGWRPSTGSISVSIATPMTPMALFSVMQFSENCENYSSNSDELPDDVKKTVLHRRRHAVFFDSVDSAAMADELSNIKNNENNVEINNNNNNVIEEVDETKAIGANFTATPSSKKLNFQLPISRQTETDECADFDNNNNIIDNNNWGTTNNQNNDQNEDDVSVVDEPNWFIGVCSRFSEFMLNFPFWRNFTRLSGIQRVELVEAICRYSFPIFFLAFNVIYWILYCYIMQSSESHHNDVDASSIIQRPDGDEDDNNFREIEYRKLVMTTTETSPNVAGIQFEKYQRKIDG